MKIIRCLISTLMLCIFLLLPPMEALAQSDNSEMQAVEVSQALGPEAMQALVSKLNEKQTAALVELIQLLDTSAGNSETTSRAEQQAFKENGIEFARKEVRVRLPSQADSVNLAEDQKKVIAAAASQAAEPDAAAGSKS